MSYNYGPRYKELVELMQQGGWNSAEMVARYANIGAKHLAKRLKAVK